MLEAPFFNECALRMHDIAALCERMSKDGFEIGLPLERYYPDLQDCVLVCATEMNSPAMIDSLVKTMEGVM